MCLVIQIYRKLMNSHGDVLHERSCNTPVGLVLSKSKHLEVLKCMLLFAKKFELEYGFSSSYATIENIRAHLNKSNFLPGVKMDICICHICVATTIMRYPSSMKLLQDESHDLFGVSHLYNRLCYNQ